jgi:ferredoxin-NADP reductase
MELVVSKVRQEADSILSFELRQATGESLSAYQPGSQWMQHSSHSQIGQSTG